MSALVKTTNRELSTIATTQTAVGMGQYLTFALMGEVYALQILNAKEIINYGYLTEVPMMPEFVSGVINLRGSVVPVIDLAARFGKGNTQIAKRTSIIIVENGTSEHSQDMGIIVDAVNEVIDINQGDIEPPPSFGVGIRLDFIDGMVKRNNRFVILLNIERVLSLEEMAHLSRLATGHFDYVSRQTES